MLREGEIIRASNTTGRCNRRPLSLQGLRIYIVLMQRPRTVRINQGTRELIVILLEQLCCVVRAFDGLPFMVIQATRKHWSYL